MPRPPAHLNAEAKREWRRLGPALIKLKVYADKLDWTAFAAYCVIYARCQRLAKDCNTAELTIVGPAGEKANPIFIMERQNYGMLRSYLAEFGLTPTTRARVIAGADDEVDDPFSKHEKGFRPNVIQGGRRG